MPLYIDQTGRTVDIPSYPKRIISLVPSLTELLYDLGLDNKVIGITKFCIHPQSWFKAKTKVGGTKKINTDVIHRLIPDLIIANKEENQKEQIDELAAYYPVWVSDVKNIDDALDMIRQVGRICDAESAALTLVAAIRHEFEKLMNPQQRIPAAYLIWKNPWMTAGGDTFIHSMMECAGLDNIFKESKRYPAITLNSLRNMGCRLVLLASEPYPFRQKHADEMQNLLSPDIKVLLVNGEMFSWYGSRMKYAPDYFKNLFAGF